MLPRAPAATNNSCVTPKIGIKASERKLRKKILDHIDGWRALKSDPAQLVTIYSDPKVTPQNSNWLGQVCMLENTALICSHSSTLVPATIIWACCMYI